LIAHAFAWRSSSLRFHSVSSALPATGARAAVALALVAGVAALVSGGLLVAATLSQPPPPSASSS